MPALSVIAGPNGSGKSTLTSYIFFEGDANLIDPDAIARSMDPQEPSSRAIPAAREAILRCRTLLSNQESFTLEQHLPATGQSHNAQRESRGGIRHFSYMLRSTTWSCT